MQTKDIKTKDDFELYVKEKLGELGEPALVASFCSKYIPQGLKARVLPWYEQTRIQALLLSLPFVAYKDDEHGFKRIWLKQGENQSTEKHSPRFASKDEFEKYLKNLIEAGHEYSLSFYIISQFSQSDKQNIATLYGRSQFSEDIFDDIPLLKVIENESGVKSVSLRQMDEISNQGDQPMENPSLQQQQTETTDPPAVVYSANEKAKLLLEKISSGLYSKEEAVRLSLLAAVACESVFFLGPPGVAKSMICQRLSEVFQTEGGEAWFEYLMNQFSTPDEIFGPVSLKALENDEYKRITKNYLPEANVAFLDEIWKASPAL